MRGLIFWGLFPFVIPQALWVRQTAPRFAAAGGEREGVTGAGRDYRLIAIGDSIIAGVGAGTLDNALVGQTAKALADRLHGRIHWQAIGKIGVDAGSTVQRLVPKLPDSSADFFIVSIGVNDVTSLSRLSTWLENIRQLLAALQQHSPQAVIAFAGLPPLKDFPLLPQPLRALFGMRAESLDRAARQALARHPTAIHVPVAFDPDPEKFAADGFHPSEVGYQEFGQAMATAIVERLESAS